MVTFMIYVLSKL